MNGGCHSFQPLLNTFVKMFPKAVMLKDKEGISAFVEIKEYKTARVRFTVVETRRELIVKMSKFDAKSRAKINKWRKENR